jgi:hypothetical protein
MFPICSYNGNCPVSAGQAVFDIVYQTKGTGARCCGKQRRAEGPCARRPRGSALASVPWGGFSSRRPQVALFPLGMGSIVQYRDPLWERPHVVAISRTRRADRRRARRGAPINGASGVVPAGHGVHRSRLATGVPATSGKINTEGTEVTEGLSVPTAKQPIPSSVRSVSSVVNPFPAGHGVHRSISANREGINRRALPSPLRLRVFAVSSFVPPSRWTWGPSLESRGTRLPRADA